MALVPSLKHIHDVVGYVRGIVISVAFVFLVFAAIVLVGLETFQRRVTIEQSIPELVRALEEFRALYNQHWLIERLGFEPPVQARQRLALQPAA